MDNEEITLSVAIGCIALVWQFIKESEVICHK
jgi:hypothetical protein